MFRLRRVVRDFFGFSRGQINAFILLLPLLTVALFSLPAYRWWLRAQKPQFPADVPLLDSLVAAWDQKEGSPSDLPVADTIQKYPFDPNKVTVADMAALGFSAGLSARIVRYREKGGRFRVKSDVLKIYGMDTAFYDALYPFIELPEKRVFAGESITAKRDANFQKDYKKAKAPLLINLNDADTAALKKIYGVGEKRSLRIVKYRELLGGFISLDQLAEVYGLDSAVIKKLSEHTFIAPDFIPRKTNINVLAEKVLATHPYLSVSAAKAIVAYRFQHGDFKSLEDLRKIPMLNDQTIQKISPYLEFSKDGANSTE
ncbi:MAG TPA: helix-hairpin-helix domain-containing protein [Ohtaekwangia sp.]|nr:helix-hairpin-helix domain-containing protein [Ohtaekwangia sp.]